MRSPALTVDQIVDAAIAMAERDGLANVSMRGLARHFEVTTMAIHYHVPTRDTLVALMVDVVLGKVDAPAADAPWEQRLRTLHRSMSATVGRVPGMADYLVGHEVTDNGKRLADLTLSILLDAGFDESTAARAQATTQAFWIGRLKLNAVAARGPSRRSGKRGADARYPSLTRVATARAGLDADDYEDFALDLIITGLHALQHLAR